MGTIEDLGDTLDRKYSRFKAANDWCNDRPYILGILVTAVYIAIYSSSSRHFEFIFLIPAGIMGIFFTNFASQQVKLRRLRLEQAAQESSKVPLQPQLPN